MTRFSYRPLSLPSPFRTRLSAVCAAALTACATAKAPAARHPVAASPRIEHGTESLAAPYDWSKRGDPVELARIIARLTELTRDKPMDQGSWLKLAEAHCLMADGIAVLDWKDQGEPSAHLAAAEAAALGAAAVSDRAGADALRLRKPGKLEAINEVQGAALYWFGRSAYARAELAGYEALLLDYAILSRAMGAALAGAPSVDRGGPMRLSASLAAHPAAPSLRDLAKAKEHAERALSVDPKNPANQLAYLEHYALPAQDGAAVTSALQQIAALSPSSPEDVIALARAKQLASTIESHLE